MTLAQRPCQPCRGTVEKVSAAERDELMRELPHWRIQNRDDVEHLSRTFRFPSYRQAVSFTCAVAELAEAEDHHPRLVLEWGQVTVEWWTHTLGGLHINDFILAARCNSLHAEPSP